MSKDDELLAKAAALAPKPKRKKPPAQVAPPGGEPPAKQAQPPQLAAAKDKAGRPKKTELDEKYLEQLQGSLQQTQQESIQEAEHLARRSQRQSPDASRARYDPVHSPGFNQRYVRARRRRRDSHPYLSGRGRGQPCLTWRSRPSLPTLTTR